MRRQMTGSIRFKNKQDGGSSYEIIKLSKDSFINFQSDSSIFLSAQTKRGKQKKRIKEEQRKREMRELQRGADRASRIVRDTRNETCMPPCKSINPLRKL
mmetsp:Transcript_32484/g.64484  ORF Transcript_32484/g.64484 Transcript_32484/m.64484 type:complete len:100 (-) Transcript_32484:1638-1937(-)